MIAELSEPKLSGHEAVVADEVAEFKKVSAKINTFTALSASTLALAACGGGGSSPAPAPAPPPGGVNPMKLTTTQAASFMGKAGFGATSADIAQVQSVGPQAWLQAQFALPRETAHWDWLVAKGYNASTFMNTRQGFDNTAWRQLIVSKDVLRQRVALALSEIIVVSIDGVASAWKAFHMAAYMDVLADNAFGNYRTLLEKISTLPAMGYYLTFVNNTKANATTGSQPDENYAREILQLFTIGLVKLNLDGSLLDNKTQETYTQEDISGLARVFTGWRLATADNTTPDRLRLPMIQDANRHEPGAKTFLGTTIAAGKTGAESLTLALDAIFAHPNVAPFISKQLIQRLVVSNPSAVFVQRVATVFNNNGSGVKGDMQAVISAILTDSEALTPPAGSLGKLREPMVRLVSWARVFGANSPQDLWDIGDTSDAGTRLGQSPGRSASVFNFFRPGYVPPGTAIAQQGLVAPELQITNESSVAGYLNYMQSTIQSGRGDVKPNYTTDWLPLAGDAQKLLDQINLQLAGGGLSAATISALKTALETISVTTTTGPLQRVEAAVLLVMAAPQYIVQK